MEGGGGLVEILPGETLAAAAAIGLGIPFQHVPALGAHGKQDVAPRRVEKVYRDNGHGRAIGEQLLVLLGHNPHEIVWGLLEALADLLQNSEGGGGFPADNVAKMSGGTAAPLGGLLIAQVLGVADLKKRDGQVV